RNSVFTHSHRTFRPARSRRASCGSGGGSSALYRTLHAPDRGAYVCLLRCRQFYSESVSVSAVADDADPIRVSFAGDVWRSGESVTRLSSDRPEFVIRNLNALVGEHHRAQIFSLVMLLISSTGIFLPLEVALNRVWGFRNNRSYFGNQLISLGLVFA